MKLARTWVGVFCALVAISLLAPAAFADEAEEEAQAAQIEAAPEATPARGRDLRIEEITVTARKREEAAQDVPIAITAVTTELQDSTIRNLADIDGYVPNVMIGESTGRPRGSSITIRGVSPSEVTDKSHDSPVAVAVDGVFMGTTSGRVIENFDLERIEVLRGPQGTLFGKNTVGGVINVFRSKPTGELGGKIRVTIGSDGQEEVRSLLNFPITEGLAAKLFFTDIEADGHMHNTFRGDDGPKKDYKNFGVALLWTPNDRFDAHLTLERFDDHSDLGASANFNTEAGVFPPPTQIGQQDLSTGFILCTVLGDCRANPLSPTSKYSTNSSNEGTYRNDVLSLTMNFEINENLRFVSVTGYHDTPVEDYISEFDGSSLEFIRIDNDNVYDQFTQELRLEGTWGNLDWVAGAYYLDSYYEQNWVTLDGFWSVVVPGMADNGPLLDADGNPTGLNVTDACLMGLLGQLACDDAVPLGSSGLGPNFTQNLFQEQDIESLAFFLQGDYQINERWAVTAGIRYTDEEKDFVGAQSYLAPLSRGYVSNFPSRINLKNDWQETTIKLGVSYRLTDDVMFYGSYSEGFKSGGFFGRNQNISDFARNQYDPELAESYELGMKGQFFDNRVQLNLAAFYNDFEDKQDSNVVLDPSTNTVATVWENIGGIDYTGAEAEVKWVVTDGLDVFATVGYLDAEYDGFFSDRFVPLALQGTVPKQNVDFLTPKQAPEWTAGAGGTYTVPVGPGDLSFHVKWNFIDELETQTYNDDFTSLDSRNFINAQVGYAWNRMRLTVYGKNLTDEVWETPLTAVWPFMGWSFVSPGTRYGVEVEVAF